MAYSTINKGSLYQNTKLYTGNAASQGDGSTQTFTDIGFGPDLVWIKNRDGTDWHDVTDTVRGATKSIYPNTNDEEDTVATALTAFTSTGFTIGSNNQVNNSPDDYVAWCWKANGAGSANTDGSLASTVSANTTSGFSIVKYTGNATNSTIGHGLGVVPKMIIIKDLDQADNWNCYHTSLGNNSHIHLNLDYAASGSSTYWQDTNPTSSFFYIESGNDVNYSGHDFVAYCFADVAGYSKFSYYIGNGDNGDGTFIYLGFKPSYVLIKQADSAGNWALSDNQRLTNSGTQDGGKGNYVPHMLATNSNAAESGFGGGASNKIDYLSNGFKMRDNGAYGNTSGSKYIYMAFGQPIISNGGVCATAR